MFAGIPIATSAYVRWHASQKPTESAGDRYLGFEIVAATRSKSSSQDRVEPPVNFQLQQGLPPGCKRNAILVSNSQINLLLVQKPGTQQNESN